MGKETTNDQVPDLTHVPVVKLPDGKELKLDTISNCHAVIEVLLEQNTFLVMELDRLEGKTAENEQP